MLRQLSLRLCIFYNKRDTHFYIEIHNIYIRKKFILLYWQRMLCLKILDPDNFVICITCVFWNNMFFYRIFQSRAKNARIFDKMIMGLLFFNEILRVNLFLGVKNGENLRFLSYFRLASTSWCQFGKKTNLGQKIRTKTAFFGNF